MMDLRSIARALGGEVVGRQVLCPGPGHSPRDRSLSVRLEPRAPGGILVHSFANDDALTCKDFVRSRLNLPRSMSACPHPLETRTSGLHQSDHLRPRALERGARA